MDGPRYATALVAIARNESCSYMHCVPPTKMTLMSDSFEVCQPIAIILVFMFPQVLQRH